MAHKLSSSSYAVFTATMGGRTIATVEISLKDFSIIQCRAFANGVCEYAEQIAGIINANKWSMLLLVILDEFGVMRFNELSRAIPDISPKVLSGHLKTLESVGLVKRNLYAEVPPRTEYALTDLGRSLIPILNQLSEWGREHLNDITKSLSRHQ